MIRDMVALVGGTRLRDINPRTVSALIARIRSDKGVCGTTLNMYFKTFRQILSSAVDNELIPRNPTDKVKAPRIDRVERRSLSEEEGRELMLRLDEAEEEAYRQREEVEARQAARAQKNWAVADAIRNGITALGLVVEDTATGARLRAKE